MMNNSNNIIIVNAACETGIEEIINHGTQKLARLRAARAKKGFKRRMEQVHVEPEATPWRRRPDGELLSQQCVNFLNHKKQCIFLVLGDPGAGKTRFMERFFETCLVEFAKELEHVEPAFLAPLPLLINLYEAFGDDRIRAEHFLDDYLERKAGLSVVELNALKTQPLVIFCDGFDEISFDGNLYQKNDWAHTWPHLKCIISSRPEKFGTALSEGDLQSALIEAFSPVPLGQGASLPKGLRIAQLSPFSPAQVSDFIGQWQTVLKNNLENNAQWPTERYQQSLADIPGLQELTANPVILSLVLYALPQIVKDREIESNELNRKQLQRLDIYNQFVAVWFQDQAIRLEKKLEKENPILLKKLKAQYDALYYEENKGQANKHYFVEPLRSYTTQLAYWTVLNQQSGKLNLEIPEDITLQPYLLDDPTQAAKQPISSLLEKGESESLCRALRSGCLLNCEGGNHTLPVEDENLRGPGKPMPRYFRFFHKSLVEYFAQAYIFTGVAGLLQMAVEEYSEFMLVLMEAHQIADEEALQSLSNKYENAPLLIATFDEKFFIWGCLNQQWQLTQLTDDEDVMACRPFEFTQEPQRIKNLNIFATLKKGHNPASRPAQVLNQRLTDVNLLKMLAERVKQENANNIPLPFKQHLEDIIQESRENPAVAYAAANAITILNYAEEPLNKLKLPGVQIPGADLSNAFLCGVNLQEANVSEVIFRGACLVNASLKKARVKGCEWGMPSAPLSFNTVVMTLRYTPDSKWLIIGDYQGKIYFVYPQTFETKKILAHSFPASRVGDAIRSMAVNGKKGLPPTYLATGGECGCIYLWQFSQQRIEKKLSDQAMLGPIYALAFHPKEDTCLASASQDGVIRLWDITNKTFKKLIGHAGPVRALSWSPEGFQLASGGRDRVVRLWQVADAAFQPLHGHTDIILCIAYSPSGKQFASGSKDMKIRLWEVTDGSSRVLEGHAGWVNCLIYSPQGNQLASGSQDYTVRLWQVAEGTSQILKKHTSAVSCIAYSSREGELVSGGVDQQVWLWQIDAGGSQVLQAHRGNVLCVAYSHKGDKLISGSEDNTIRLWKIAEGVSREIKGLKVPVRFVAYSSQMKQLAWGNSSKTIWLWNFAQNDSRKLKGHKETVLCVAYSLQGDQLASGSHDNTVRLWQTSGRCSNVLRGHTNSVCCVAYSPLGDYLASGSHDHTVQLWQTSGRCSNVLRGHTNSVCCVAYSPLGDYLASGSYDTTVRVWQVGDKVSSSELKGHKSVVSSVVYSPTGDQLASGSWDKTVRLWDMTQKKLPCIETIEVGFKVLALHWQGDFLKIAGYDTYQVQVFTYNLTDNKSRLCQWLDRKGIPFNLPFFRLNISGARDLSPDNYRFLTREGAVGKPKELLSLTLNSKEAEEESQDLAKVVAIQKILGQVRDCLQTAGQSVLNEKNPISYHQWQVYLLRITQPSYSGGSSFTAGNRHVYGLLEGLDQLGRRVFIRFDLVNEYNTSLARVKVKASFIDDALTLEKARAAFMILFRKDEGALPTQLVCHRAGSFKKTERMNELLTKIINEHSRQSPSEPASSHIRYQFRGGNEQSNQAHNCLSWLRYLLGEFKELKMPRSVMDRLYADPQSVLPTPSLFFTSPSELKTVDTRGWAGQANEVALIPKQKKGAFSKG